MSWFDTSGLASLAKTALKEAQKTIDKALDIKEDEAVTGDVKPIETKRIMMKQSLSNPSIDSNIWGSFTGSFFDSPTVDRIEHPTTPPVTTPPTSKRHNSESSVDILSTPTTPPSTITSPDVPSTIHGSESIELLDTPTSEMIDRSDSVPISSVSVISEEDDDNTDKNPLKLSPESVEIINDDADSLDDDSISYNTVSESMAMITVIDRDDQIPITIPPSRTGLHLSLGAPLTELPIKLIPPATDSSTESIQTFTNDEQQVPNQLEEAMLDKSIDNYDSQTQRSDSTQSFEDVQQILLKEAATHKTLSQSSDERSDIVKITSEQSDHTSGDDVETTTSSDIEIISSPNGDSSSTSSNHPVNGQTNALDGKFSKPHRGHYREPSGASITSILSNVSDESPTGTHTIETEKLLRRIGELSELLEAREYKLMELGRQNAELMERCADMKQQIEQMKKRSDSLEMATLADDYTQRMSALEKKFQQSIRDRDNLRKQLFDARTELTGKVGKDEMDRMVSERQAVIDELKAEGDKLSKQVLQHSNIIKKLRIKERETDGTVKGQKEEIEQLMEETDRLKKSLSAKDEMERSQIEAVHKLSADKQKLEAITAKLQSENEDLQQKHQTIQSSFGLIKKQLTEYQLNNSELNRRSDELAILQAENRQQLSDRYQLTSELETARLKLINLEAVSRTTELKLKQENQELLRRLEKSEQRSEELAQSIGDATRPLIKQITAIQATLNSRTMAWDEQEHRYLQQISDYKEKFNEFAANKQTELNKIIDQQRQIDHLNGQLYEMERRNDDLMTERQQNQMTHEIEQSNLRNDFVQLQEQFDEMNRERIRLKDEIDSLNEQLNGERQTIVGCDETIRKVDGNDSDMLRKDNESPTLSVGRISIADSLSSNLWPLEDIDCGSNSGGRSSIYGGGASISNTFGGSFHYTGLQSNATMLETLQANLKQRDGENHQLQWELSKLQSERNYLMAEMSKLSSQLEIINEKLATHDELDERFKDLQKRYDALLQMYGEKVEQTEELRLDLVEVKEAYRTQINDLLLHQKRLLTGDGSK